MSARLQCGVLEWGFASGSSGRSLDWHHDAHAGRTNIRWLLPTVPWVWVADCGCDECESARGAWREAEARRDAENGQPGVGFCEVA